MSYSDVMSTISAIAAFIAIPASYFCGVRVGKVNDRRKEFNAVAEPVIIALEDHIEYLRYPSIPSRYVECDQASLPITIVSALRRRLSDKDKDKFNALHQQYADCLDYLTANPAPMIGSDEEWINKYPEAISLCEKIIELIKLR
ncbi:TPA: hypothetical protein VEO38_001981 [Providencia alcalifaciens]|nr:hypothetical protein [Providencia alcalifaciens]